MLATIHYDTWNVPNMQHITPKFEKMVSFEDIRSGGHKKIKGPAHTIEDLVAGVLALSSARPSAGTVLTTNLDMFSFQNHKQDLRDSHGTSSVENLIASYQ